MRFFLLCLGFFLVPALARADIATDEVLANLSRVKSAHAHFTETRHMAVLTQPLIATGTLAYTAPDGIEKDTLTPRAETLSVRGDMLTMTGEDGTRSLSLSDMPEIDALVTALRATLAGDRAALEKHYTVTAQGDASGWILLLQPNEPAVEHAIQYVRLSGSHDRLTGLEVRQTNGDESDMQIVPDSP